MGTDCLVGAGAQVETVQIGDATGEYVVGVWKADNAGNWTWSHEPYLQRLRWQENGFAFEILYMGPPEEVRKADLIAIAESMKYEYERSPSRNDTKSCADCGSNKIRCQLTNCIHKWRG